MQRQTKQRSAIQLAVESSNRPLSIDELHQDAGKDVKNLGVATVYRTVKSLCEDEVIRRIEIPGEQPRYEKAELSHHHHGYCEQCEKVFEAEGCMAAIDELAPEGFKVHRHEITFYGLCQGCQNKDR